MWRSSGRGCTVTPSAPKRCTSMAAFTISGLLPPRLFLSVANLLMLTESLVGMRQIYAPHCRPFLRERIEMRSCCLAIGTMNGASQQTIHSTTSAGYPKKNRLLKHKRFINYFITERRTTLIFLCLFFRPYFNSIIHNKNTFGK